MLCISNTENVIFLNNQVALNFLKNDFKTSIIKHFCRNNFAFAITSQLYDILNFGLLFLFISIFFSIRICALILTKRLKLIKTVLNNEYLEKCVPIIYLCLYTNNRTFSLCNIIYTELAKHTYFVIITVI